MNYAEFLGQIAQDAETTPEVVRACLNAMPSALMMCRENEDLRTPLGTFRLVRRPRKRVLLRNGEEVFSEERLQVRLRIAQTLIRPVEENAGTTSGSSE